MTSSSLNLADKQELALLAEIIADVRSATPRAEFILVGAAARDLLLFQAYDIRVPRATADIDLGLAANDWEEFQKVHESLLVSGNFHSHAKSTYKLVHRSTVEVDLIPFGGGVERPDGTIAWPPEEDTVMRVLGFQAAYASSIHVFLPLNQQVAVASLPALAVLKVLAWAGRRPIGSRKDASDLILILGNYLEAGQADRVYAEENHLLALEDFDYELAGSWLAGQDARSLLRNYSPQSNRVEQEVRSVLEPEVDPDGPLRLIGDLNSMNPERALHLLAAFLNGFKGMTNFH